MLSSTVNEKASEMAKWEWAFCRESNSTRSLRHRKYSSQSSRSLATESHSSVNHFVLAFASCLIQYSPSSHLSSSLILLFLLIDLISAAAVLEYILTFHYLALEIGKYIQKLNYLFFPHRVYNLSGYVLTFLGILLRNERSSRYTRVIYSQLVYMDFQYHLPTITQKTVHR
jgi:hypothetical protein